MAESISFAAPAAIGTAPTVSTLRLMALHKRREPWSIHAEVLADELLATKKLYDVHIADAVVAQPLIISLNKSNNSVTSEEKRVLQWLQANVNPATGVTYLPAGGVYQGAPD